MICVNYSSAETAIFWDDEFNKITADALDRCDARESFCWHGLYLIPALIGNSKASKVWYEIMYPFQWITTM